MLFAFKLIGRCICIGVDIVGVISCELKAVATCVDNTLFAVADKVVCDLADDRAVGIISENLSNRRDESQKIPRNQAKKAASKSVDQHTVMTSSQAFCNSKRIS